MVYVGDISNELLGLWDPLIQGGHHLVGCLIGRVPIKYQIVTIGGVLPLIDNPWFINPGLTLTLMLPFLNDY